MTSAFSFFLPPSSFAFVFYSHLLMDINRSRKQKRWQKEVLKKKNKKKKVTSASRGNTIRERQCSSLLTGNVTLYKLTSVSSFSTVHSNTIGLAKTFVQIFYKLAWKNLNEIFGQPNSCEWRRKWQPTQYSCLENPTDRGAWQTTVNGITKSLKWLSNFTFT